LGFKIGGMDKNTIVSELQKRTKIGEEEIRMEREEDNGRKMAGRKMEEKNGV